MFNVFMYLQLGPLWLCWFLYDALNLAMCIAAFVMSSRFKEEQRKGKSSRRTIGWLAWLILEVSPNQTMTSAKVNKQINNVITFYLYKHILEIDFIEQHIKSDIKWNRGV